MRQARYRRPGLAPLELALAAPLLLLLALIIWKFGQAGLTKARTLVRARNDAWSRRATGGASEGTLPGPGAFTVLRSDGDMSAGLAFGSDSRPVKLAPVLPLTSQAQSRLRVLGNTWDHRTFGFRERGQMEFDPRLAGLGPGGIGSLAALLDKLESAEDITGKLAKILQEVRALSAPLGNMKGLIRDLKKIVRDAASQVAAVIERAIRALGFGNKTLSQVKDALKKAEASLDIIDAISEFTDRFDGIDPFSNINSSDAENKIKRLLREAESIKP